MVIGLIISMFLLGLIVILQMISISIGSGTFATISREESTPFECGFDFTEVARLPFSIAYFMLTLIFLLFDLELIFLLFLPLSCISNFPVTSVFISLNFVFLLGLGLVYEWSIGNLDWCLPR